MDLELDSNFKEFLSLLEHHGAKYLLIGGYAVNYHGYHRSTNDMDIFISASSENAAKVTNALHEFGFVEVTEEMLATPSSMIRMGIEPTKLEVTNFIDGVTFEECFEQRLRVVLDGLTINLISLPDLRRNKQASGRPKDLADLDGLPEI
jgi:predicted nucleotidyltransferase